MLKRLKAWRHHRLARAAKRDATAELEINARLNKAAADFGEQSQRLARVKDQLQSTRSQRRADNITEHPMKTINGRTL